MKEKIQSFVCLIIILLLGGGIWLNKVDIDRQYTEYNSIQGKQGEKPDLSWFDGTSTVCYKYLRDNLNDPTGLKIVARTIPKKIGEGIWEQVIEYRAKNGFGAYMLEAKRFTFTNKEVLRIESSSSLR